MIKNGWMDGISINWDLHGTPHMLDSYYLLDVALCRSFTMCHMLYVLLFLCRFHANLI